MKKIISMILAVAMMFALAVFAMAAGSSDTLNDTETSTGALDVSVTVVPAAKSYNITVTWDNDLDFEYRFGNWTTGNTNDYAAGTWSHTKTNVTVQNNSNAEIWYKATYATVTVDGVTLSMSGNPTGNLEACTRGAAGVTGQFAIDVTGNPQTNTASNHTYDAGDLVVTISTTGAVA